MAKLYIVIYLAGHIGGTVGPLPYGFEECDRRAAEQMATADPSVVTPQGYRASDVKLVCEWHETRPGNDPEAGKPRP